MSRVEITGVDTSKLDILDNDRMVYLLRQVKQGDKQARDELVKGNLKLILSVIKKVNSKNEQADDLFQVGSIGLLKAIDNFDESHGVKFSTYAVPMIIGEIRRYLRDNGLVRVSRSLKDIAYKVLSFKEEYLKNNQKEPTIDIISNEIGVDKIDIIMALEAIQDPISIYTPIYNNGTDAIELIDQISDHASFENDIERKSMVKRALLELNDREKRIIIERYFNDKTQIEIADSLGISQAQVSRLEKNALKIMYNALI